MLLPGVFWSLIALCAFWKTEADREAILARGNRCMESGLRWIVCQFALREAKRMGFEAWLEAEERKNIQIPTLQIIPETASLQADVEAYVRKHLGS